VPSSTLETGGMQLDAFDSLLLLPIYTFPFGLCRSWTKDTPQSHCAFEYVAAHLRDERRLTGQKILLDKRGAPLYTSLCREPRLAVPNILNYILYRAGVYSAGAEGLRPLRHPRV
jgi:hypothetical protein